MFSFALLLTFVGLGLGGIGYRLGFNIGRGYALQDYDAYSHGYYSGVASAGEYMDRDTTDPKNVCYNIKKEPV